MSKYTVTASATPPIAIAYLSGTLRANGYDLQSIDAIGEDIDRMIPIEGTVGFAQGLPIDRIVERIDAVDAAAIGRLANRVFAGVPTLAALGPVGPVDRLAGWTARPNAAE